VSIVIVVGLHAEARLARRLGFRVVIGGGTAAGAAAAVQQAIAEGASGLVSFGLAGGIQPGLPAGTLIVPSTVLCDGVAAAADPDLTARLGGATRHRLLAPDAIVPDAATKLLLWQQTGAAALDLETGAVVRAAAAHGLPFGALRAICDPAERDLPPAALAALDSQGAIGLARVMGSLLARPGQLPALLQVAADAAAARRALADRIRAIESGRAIERSNVRTRPWSRSQAEIRQEGAALLDLPPEAGPLDTIHLAGCQVEGDLLPL
jgi:adenosylhomocysteine nucleosidase